MYVVWKVMYATLTIGLDAGCPHCFCLRTYMFSPFQWWDWMGMLGGLLVKYVG